MGPRKPPRRVFCRIILLDGVPVRVSGDRNWEPTPADIQAFREVVAALRNQVSRKAGLDICALDGPDSANTDQRGEQPT